MNGRETITVLHVDDEPDFADLAAEFLEREDERISVQTATSTAEGLERLSESQINCIVSDYEMPGKNGIEFLETVREDYPDLPFILYTGKGSEEVASDAISAGVSDYLQKERGTEQYELLANDIVTFVDKYRTEQELDTLRRQYTKLAEQNFVGIYIIQDGEFIYANPRLADIHGYDNPDEVIGMSPLDLVAPNERERVQSNLEQRLSDNVAEMQYQTVGLTNAGDFIDIELHGSRIELDGEPAVIGAELDVTKRNEERRRLEFLETLENELTELSIDFLKTQDADLQALIDDALKRIGTLVEADRSYVFQIDQETDTLSNTHEWCADGVEPQSDKLQDLDVDTFPWLLPQLRDSDTVTIPDVSQLPPEADDLQRVLTEQNIDSLILTPMISDETLVGFIGFDWVEEQESWSEEFVDILQMVSELITTKQKQEARRKELERYESYLEHAQDIVTVADENGIILDQNPAIERVLGVDSGGRIGDRVFDYVHPDDRQGMKEAFEEFVTDDTNTTARIEFRYEDGDGNYRWLEAIGIDQTNTTVGGYVVHSRDISKRKEREEKYRNLFENSRDALMVFDREGYIDCNAKTLELFGVDSTDEFLDYSPWGLSPDEQPDGRESQIAAKEHIEKAFEEGEDFFEWTHQHADGTEFPAEVKLSRFSYGSETVLLALIRDVSERKERERELRDLKDRFQTLFEKAPEEIAIHDSSGDIHAVNQQEIDKLGYSREELTAMNVADFQGEYAQGELQTLWDEIDIGETRKVAGKHVRKDGSTYPVAVWMNKININEEERILAFVRDITDRKNREQELERRNERLDEFASVVSHDLQNPLNVAEGRLELAQEDCESDHLEAIGTAIDRMERITEDVLWLAREGQDIGSLDAVVVQEAIDAAWDIVADREEHADLQYADDALSTATIEADDDRFRQLVENLFSNAIEHVGEDVTVTVGAVENGFYVEDDGPGIPEDRRDEVFTAGYSTSEEGTGFGLSIVKQIVEAHGWKIRVTEGAQSGARFEISGVEFAVE